MMLGVRCIAVAHLAAGQQQRRSRSAIIARGHGAAMPGLGARSASSSASAVVPGVPLPQTAGTRRSGCPARGRLGEVRRRAVQLGERLRAAASPDRRSVRPSQSAQACRNGLSAASAQAARLAGSGIGRPVAAQVQFQIAGAAAGARRARRRSWHSGCLSRVSSASAGQPAARRARRHGAGTGPAATAAAAGRRCRRAGCPSGRARRSTCRVSIRSGVISAAVCPVLGRLAQAQRDGQRLGARATGASISVTSPRWRWPGRSGPGLRACHCVGDRRGRSASETSRLRAGDGARRVGPAADVAGAQPERLHQPAEAELRVILGRSSRRRPEPAQTAAGMSKSKPGRTTAPCGRRATACISSCVVPRDPVEPARRCTGSAGGVARQRRSGVSITASRWRASASGAVAAAGSDEIARRWREMSASAPNGPTDR